MIRRLMLLAAITNGVAALITHNPLFAIGAAFMFLAAILRRTR